MENDQLTNLLTIYESATDPLEKLKHGYELARHYFFNLNQIEDAECCLLQLLQIAENINNEQEIADICNFLGAIYRNTQMFDEAKEALQRAISLGEKLQDYSLQRRAYINLGGLYQNIYNHSQAIDCFEKALKIAETLGDLEGMGLAITSIGRTYREINEHQKAVNYIRQALRILPADYTQIYLLYLNIAIAYAELKDYHLAIGYLKRAIPLLEKVNLRSAVAEFYCRISEALIKLKKYDKAMDYVLRAKMYIAEHQLDAVNVELRLCLILINIYYENGDIELTEQYIQKYLSLGEAEQERLRDFYAIAVTFYEKQGKIDQAYKYLQKYNEVNKAILDEEMQTNMAIKMANFEYEREKHTAEVLRQKNDELLKLHAEKDNLMNTISHDLKNYLGATQQALDIFALKEKEMTENKYIKIVITSTARSLNLVKEILYSTKVSASADALNLQTVNISSVVAENEDTLNLRASKKGINVVFEYAPEPLMVQLDSEKWHRVFENLTTNAIKFTSAGKDIRISTKREGEFALITIADSGIGIASENIGKLFTPFSGVGRKGTDGEESTGLGLSIVKKLVELHGGEIMVTSEVGKGTEFVVTLKIIT